MKKFEVPAINVMEIKVEDVITASGDSVTCDQDGCPTYTGDL